MARETLRRFYADAASLEKVLALAGEAYHEKAAAFIEKLAGFGIEKSHIHVEDFAIFRHRGLAAAIESFLLANPQEPLPLERITVARYARRGSHRADLADLDRDFAAAAEQIRHFASRCNVDVALQVFLDELDPDRAIALAERAATCRLDALGFYFQFPDLTPAEAAGLRADLARLCGHPALRDSRVTLGNFPFCFLPTARFPLAYREAIEPLKGHIGAQRDLVHDLTARACIGPSPCATCRCRAACHAYTDVVDHPAYAPLLAPRVETTVIFAGGSIAAADTAPDPDLVWTGPAEQGDMLAAVLEGFSTILLVDGFFYTRFPCTTFEVMLALEVGVRVLGSSSIGALRAVELDRHGMEGVGYVYEYLKRQEIKPYHVVAQTYDQEHRQFTPALIQLHYVLERAQAAGAMSAAEGEAARAAAERVPFRELSWDLLPPAAAAFRMREGAGALDIKRLDALALLDRFRTGRAQREQESGHLLFRQARDRYLRILSAKFRSDPDLALPANWRAGEEPAARADGARDRRACSAAETCVRARRFFADLDVVVADTSRFDPSSQHILSVFFLPFYHLDYYPSSATGTGNDFDAALASAYMELVERAPVAARHISELSRSAWNEPLFPLDQLPQFYNWGAAGQVKQRAADGHGCVRVTDIVAGGEVLIPKSAVMFGFSGTDGNASGNTLAEAVLYGLYELIERDTAQLHISDPELRRRRPEFLTDPETLADPRTRALLHEAEAKGCRLLLYQLPNSYRLPCVMCEVYDHNRAIQCHGGIAVRADVRAAARAAVGEAYMQYITYFAGTRDDYRAHANLKSARLAYENARATLFDAPASRAACAPAVFPTLALELEHVLARLTEQDVAHILVADLSPLATYALKCVKVIVPGLELWFCPDYQASPFRAARVEKLKDMMAASGGRGAFPA